MAPEAESYTTGCMIRGCYVYKGVWLSYIREVLYCHCDKRSAEMPLGSGTAAKQNLNICSLEVLLKRHWLMKSQHGSVTCAAMNELKRKYQCNCGIEICKPATSRRIHTN